MKVVHIQRKRPPERFSIEGYFERVRYSLSQRADIRLCCLPFFSRGLFRRIANIVYAALQQGDINHVTGDIHYAVLCLSPRKTVLTVHDCEVLERLTGWKRWIVKTFWYTLPVRRVRMITVNSQETRDKLLTVVNYPQDQIRVIPVSISTQHAPAVSTFCSERPRILQIGTKANKNLLRLAAALEGFPCELHIVGPLNKQQRACLATHKINYTNHLYVSDEELVQQYQAADIISFVSTHEGFGMPIVEAQWTERVCVTSNCSSMPEVAGDGACFVDPLDVQSIREGFTRVTVDAEYRNSLIQNGRVNRRRFDSEQIAEAFFNLYVELHRESKNSNVK